MIILWKKVRFSILDRCLKKWCLKNLPIFWEKQRQKNWAKNAEFFIIFLLKKTSSKKRNIVEYSLLCFIKHSCSFSSKRIFYVLKINHKIVLFNNIKVKKCIFLPKMLLMKTKNEFIFRIKYSKKWNTWPNFLTKQNKKFENKKKKQGFSTIWRKLEKKRKKNS